MAVKQISSEVLEGRTNNVFFPFDLSPSSKDIESFLDYKMDKETAFLIDSITGEEALQLLIQRLV